MQPFKFIDSGPGPTYLESAEPFSGYDSFKWVERYRDPGEFEIKAKLSSGLRTFLTRGSLISHMETLDVGVIENHELVEAAGEEPQIRITGRTLDGYAMENRIVGAIFSSNPTPPPAEYLLAADTLADQVHKLINDHLGSTALANDQLTGVLPSVFSSVNEGPIEARVVKRQSLHKAVVELLAINDYGIRVIRRNGFSEFPTATTLLYIHKGVDRSDEVTFSSQTGDISDAEYLWSIKSLKNVAYVKGRYVEVMVYGSGPPTGFDRRTMMVDASDLDDYFDTTPTGTDLTNIRNKMTIRGQQALENQQEVSITRADISPNSNLRYRKDYNIGDIVSIDGNFGDIEKRRIIEFAQIDEKGASSGHPTLAEIPPNAVL